MEQDSTPKTGDVNVRDWVSCCKHQIGDEPAIIANDLCKRLRDLPPAMQGRVPVSPAKVSEELGAVALRLSARPEGAHAVRIGDGSGKRVAIQAWICAEVVCWLWSCLSELMAEFLRYTRDFATETLKSSRSTRAARARGEDFTPEMWQTAANVIVASVDADADGAFETLSLEECVELVNQYCSCAFGATNASGLVRVRFEVGVGLLPSQDFLCLFFLFFVFFYLILVPHPLVPPEHAQSMVWGHQSMPWRHQTMLWCHQIDIVTF